MKKSLSHYFLATTFAFGLFISTFQLASAGVVQDYQGQNLLIFETQYRDQIAGQTNSPAQNYRTNLVDTLDALITCLYQGSDTAKNWQFGNVGTNASPDILAGKLNQTDHPCNAAQASLTAARTRADNDANGKYAPVVIADRLATMTIWRQPTSAGLVYDRNSTPDGRDQAARTKLNSFSDCLMQTTGDHLNWQVAGITASSTSTQLRAAIRAAGDSQPCRSELQTTSQHQPRAATPTTTPTAVPSSTTTAAPPAADGSQPAPVTGPVGGAPATGGNPTIYTGPGFVNVTPFSVFGRVSIDRIINNVINYISGFLATIAVLSLMYGGVLYMTAGGDNGKIGKAKQVIVLTMVGLIIGSFAYMIIIFTTRLFYGS